MAPVALNSDPASPFYYQASQTAILLIDYQNMALARLPHKRSAVTGTANRLREWACQNNSLIVHCLVRADQAPEPQSKMTQRWPMIQQNVKAHPNVAAECVELATPVDAEADMEITVSRRVGLVSALKSDGLRDLLIQHEIESLVIAGVSTSGCILSTARAAADERFVATVIEDGCGDPVEGLHETLIENVLPMTVNVMDSDSWLNSWKPT